MAKKQTRRTISVTGESYRRFAAYCATRGASMSSLVEAHILAIVEGIEDPGGLPPQRRAEVVTLTCAQCGATFEREKCRLSPGAINAFCSSAHRIAFQVASRQVERARDALAAKRAQKNPDLASPARDDSPETACRGAAAMPISGRRTPQDVPHTAEVQRVQGEGVTGRRDGRIEREKPATPQSWCGSCGASFASATIQPHRCVRPRVARPSDAQKAAHAGLVKAPMPRTIESAEATQARIAREGREALVRREPTAWSEARPAPQKAEIEKRGPSNVVVW